MLLLRIITTSSTSQEIIGLKDNSWFRVRIKVEKCFSNLDNLRQSCNVNYFIPTRDFLQQVPSEEGKEGKGKTIKNDTNHT